MVTSIFLAKVLGLFLIADGLLAITRRDDLMSALNDLKNNKAVMMGIGMIVFVLGLLITTTHNVWLGAGFQIVITILGWAVVIKGLLLLLMPADFSVNLITKFNKPQIYTVAGYITVLIGIWLALSGFIL